MRRWLLLILVLLPLMTAPVHAGIIFGRKKEKPDPNKRVPELVTIVKTDKDADKREKAISELRDFDANVYPDIITTLIDALQNDQKTGVRIEAIQALSKIRPVSQTVGGALEQALHKDSSMRVRLHARTALLQYQWAGYRSSKKTENLPLNSTTKEPPLAGVPAVNTKGPSPRLLPRPMPVGPSRRTGPLNSRTTSKEPPLVAPQYNKEPPLAPVPVKEPPLAPAPGKDSTPAPTSPAKTEGPPLEGPPLE